MPMYEVDLVMTSRETVAEYSNATVDLWLAKYAV